MKKIGLLTFHNASNYGAVFQAYALQTALKKLDIESEFINYQSETIDKVYRPYNFEGNVLKGLIKFLLFSYRKSKTNSVFTEFIEEYLDINKTKLFQKEAVEKFENNKYSHIIVGSDQVWNFGITDYDTSYLLNFVSNKDIFKASYAASFGNMKVDFQEKKILLEHLKSFDAISVREKEGSELIKELLPDVNCFVHVDPTLLLEIDDWRTLSQVPKEDNYILIYTVKMPLELIQLAKKMAKEKNMKLVYLNDSKKHFDITYLKSKTPNEFLGYFENASYIFTNSFHGTVFSIMFNKQFLVELDAKDGTKNTRAMNLLKICRLEKNVLSKNYNITLAEKIDWEQVSNLIGAEREKGYQYLKELTSMKKVEDIL